MSLAGCSPSRTLGCGQSQDGCSAGWQARLRGQMEAITEILDTLAGKVPIEMSPGKLFLPVAW